MCSSDLGLWLPRRPRHAANASATYTLPEGYTFGVAARWAGDSFDNAANTTRFSPYTLIDVRADVPVSPALRFFARVENVFDESYSTAYRYNAIGRSFYAGFRGRF